jgi:hypothetical protein
LTPQLLGHLTRLATYAPFRPAGRLLRQLLGVTVSEATVRRHTEGLGAALVAVGAAEQARLEQEAPLPPPGPDQLLLSTDGAFVPLVGGVWSEVKTLVVGQVVAPTAPGAEPHCTALTYFSRLAPLEEFLTAAYPEIYRRGVETAAHVAAVQDGAEWCQRFVDFHRPDARRILDFPHAAQRLAECARLCFGEESERAAAWSTTVRELLRQGGPAPVTVALTTLPPANTAEHARQLQEHQAYLEQRWAQMEYPTFRAEGWPIGSGCVESANKLVVEARLKGPGMHWAPRHVNPLLALRNAECNERWEESWQRACHQLRTARPRATSPAAAPPPPASGLPSPAPSAPSPVPEVRPPGGEPSCPSAKKAPHPWQRYHPGWLSAPRRKPAAKK